MITQSLEVRVAAAERLSMAIGYLQRDHALTFSEAVAALQMTLDTAHTDDDMPGGGYLVIT